MKKSLLNSSTINRKEVHDCNEAMRKRGLMGKVRTIKDTSANKIE